MYAKIINENVDTSNMSELDLYIVERPNSLTDSSGIQYPISVLDKFSRIEILNLFNIREVINSNNYNESEWDVDLQERVFSHYSISTNNEFILKNFILQDKPQDIIDRVNAERELEASIEYRKRRKEAYINELSPEKDPISTLGDVVDALYQAIYHGEVEKLNELAIKIENIKSIYPKPSANTA
jgi:hypothetical protein